MWFYNLFLKTGGLTWENWERATTKRVLPAPSLPPEQPADAAVSEPWTWTTLPWTWRTLASDLCADSFCNSKPAEARHRPRKRVAPARTSYKKRLVVALGLFGHCHGFSDTFQLQSETVDRQSLRKYRGYNGMLSTANIDLGDLSALQLRTRASNALFSASAGSNSRAFSAIADTGCSRSCSNDKTDFVPGTLEELDKPVALGGIAGSLLITHSGMVHWETVDAFGNIIEFNTRAFYHPDLPGRLFSPQAYLKEQAILRGHKMDPDDHFKVMADRAEWHMDGQKLLSMEYDSSFLPRMTLFHKGHAASTLKAMHTVMHDSNKNLGPLGRIWMKWHVKLGHLGFSHVRALALGGYLDKLALGLRREDVDLPHCATCQFGSQVRLKDGATTTFKNPEVTGALKVGQLIPGQRIFTDQLESRVRGRLLHTAGRESASDKFCGSSVFCDAASGLIHVEHQVTLNATDTINAKTSFERMARDHGVQIDSYHTDNGVYKSQAFTQEIIDKEQKLRFSGVGAKWQNGVAEGAIKIVVTKARTMMIHAALHWPDVDDETLWPLAVSHAAYLYNHTPSETTGTSPMEIFSRTISAHKALTHAHTWGCPVYVLEPRLTSAGGKIPKWKPRSRRAQFVGVSPSHAENVAMVRNLRTGYLSPQFHVVFDDQFETVFADENSVPPNWDDLCIFERFEVAFDKEAPQLGPEWQDPREPLQPSVAIQRKKLYHELQTKDKEIKEDFAFQAPPPRLAPREHPLSAPREPPLRAPREPPLSAPREPSNLEQLTQATERLQLKSTREQQRAPSALVRKPHVPRVKVQASPPRRQPSRTAKHKSISRLSPKMHGKSHDPIAAMLSQLEHKFGLASGMSPHAAALMAANSHGLDPATGLQEDFHPWQVQSPLVLQGLQGKAKDPDLPSTREALTGPNADGFWAAMDKEIASLELKDAWEIVHRSSIPPGMSAVPGTWAHRVKRLPCGTLSKLKSRWCCRGDLQSLDSPTYSPMVGWPTIRAGMLLAATHGWESRQVDFTNAFLQSDQPEDQPLYMEMPQFYRPLGCEDLDLVLRMKKSIYGQVNSPKLFYEHLCVGMQKLGFEAAASDPCLFIHKTLPIMVMNYCDDQIWLSPDNALMEEQIDKLKALNYDLTLEPRGDSFGEGTLFGFLGINFKRVGDSIELTQEGLIEKVIKLTGMTDATDRDTPAATAPLGSDKEGAPFDEKWSYQSAAGMLLYISSNTRPDIQFAVHQVCRFSHAPKHSHGQALKRIIRYLVSTSKKGLLFKPNLEEGLNAYVDADFCGLYGYEDEQDPVSVRSRTGFTLTLFGCPIIWQSKLQDSQTLSSTASEYIAFSHVMREIIPMRALLKEIVSKIDLKCSHKTLVHSTVFEDNQGCISLVNVPKMSTRNKYIALKYHFFRSHIGKDTDGSGGSVNAKYISTLEQKADIFTKGLGPAQFKVIRKLLMGW